MKTRIKRHFPDSEINLVNGFGRLVSETFKGVHVTLHLDNGIPEFAEVFHKGEEALYARINLQFDGGTLSDYDGVFDLPLEVGTMLEELGYTVEAYL